MATTTAPTEAWHYPPELVELTVKAVSLLNRGKEGELDFFRGAGVPRTMLADLEQQVAVDRNAISKAEIARRVITRLNGAGDGMIGPRREILNRIVRTESFEQCWPDDRLPAKGVVAEIRDVVNKRDSYTRAKRLETVLNRLFALDGIGIREAFHVVGDETEGIVEQIDGAIELDGEIYLVEMKWLDEPVGTAEISPHLVRLFSRSEARGIFISQSRFTDPAIAQSKQALAQRVSVLCELEEIVHVLDQGADAARYFREKVRAAITERRPLHR